MMALSLSAVSAENSTDIISGEVSGGVDVATQNPWTTSGELSYDIPADAKDIKTANVYVNVYSGSAQPTYGANANVSLKTVNGENQLASEKLWTEDGSADGTIYPVNDHVNKCYSDFQMVYDITDSLKGLNGTGITLKVNTFAMENKSFDGRIKLIALFLAYDDGDIDTVNYWLDTTQKWSKTNITTDFATKDVTNIAGAELTNIALSSADGSYKLNGEFLIDPEHKAGNYYQYNRWDVTDIIKEGQDTEFVSTNVGTGTYSSLKNVFSLLTVKSKVEADVSFTTEYTSVPAVYAGTNNTVTIKVNSSKSGKYLVELLADGTVVNSTEIDADGVTTLLLTDPTVRPVDETTVNGANNTKVVYTVNLLCGEEVLASANRTLPVLYNGNLGYDLEYDVTGFIPFYEMDITGDVVIDVKDASSYLGAAAMNRTDVWAVNLTEDDSLVNAFLFVPYNWFNGKTYNETEDMFDLTFNGEEIAPYMWLRDQGNLGNYGVYGYGVLAYHVTKFVSNGDNTLVLNKKFATPAVYPSVLVYMYNTDGGAFKHVSILNGADLLANSYNNAGRTVKSDSKFVTDLNDVVNATLYVLAASAQAGEGNIIFNGEEFADVWSGTSSTTDLFTADVTGSLGEVNNISFVATGSTILALPQILVTSTDITMSVDSIKTEYTSVPTAYAGTNNTLTVTVTTSLSGEYELALIADGMVVTSIPVNLTNGTASFDITDPTIRPVNETTVSGAENDHVEYSVELLYNDVYSAKETISVPVLYNGNLGKDFEYDAKFIENTRVVTVTGGISVDIMDVSSYLGAAAMNRTDVSTLVLGDSETLAQAYICIPYNWFNGKTYAETDDMFNVTFNGKEIPPLLWYRDQGNLGNYGVYGYGVFIYEVTDLVIEGNNTLVLNKKFATPAVYPTSFLYLLNNSQSNSTFDVYIYGGADLLANSNNKAGRIVKTDNAATVNADKVTDAKLYVFAASAQAGEGNIIFNGEEFSDVWSGTSSTTDMAIFDVTGIIKNSNDISFVATGSTILALPQIIVIETVNEAAEPVAPRFTNMVIADGKLTAALTLPTGECVADAFVTVTVDEQVINTTTDANGTLTVEDVLGKVVKLEFAGNDTLLPTDFVIDLTGDKPAMDSTAFVSSDFEQYACDYYEGERGGFFKYRLTDSKGNPLANKTVFIGYNGVTLNNTTDADGYAALQINLKNAGLYTFVIVFLGDENYKATMAVHKINILKKESSIAASAKTFKATAKTKKYTVTLKTKPGSSADGKTYLAKGKKITLAINGKTYTAKTNAKGQATFSLKITKKGKFTASIKFAGDNTYKASSKSAKITIK
ncbi:DUF3344 domain-containing protein [Methanobrevibacter sp.]